MSRLKIHELRCSIQLLVKKKKEGLNFSFFTIAVPIMETGSCISRKVRDCGTQVRQTHLASHPQNFEVKNKITKSISEEIQKVLITARPENRTLNKATQTGKYGPWDKHGNIRCQSIKMPSEQCQRKLFAKPKPGPIPKVTPTIAKTVILKSKNKIKYCTDLVREIKSQAEFDKTFNDIACSLEKRITDKRLSK